MPGHRIRDHGSYLLVLRLRRGQTITVGALGRTTFRAGYYVYVGSAMNGLTARIARHRRRRKSCHWHIDYLRTRAAFCVAVAIPCVGRIECVLARRVAGIAGWEVPGFGCSDCGCRSHLFGFGRDPLQTRTFRRLAR